MARVILLTDFSEEYAKLLLRGIVRYSKEHDPWVLCKMPHSYRDLHGIQGVVDFALKWRADAIIAQFYPSDDVSLFARHGIIAIAQDFKSRFEEIPNITGAHYKAGQLGAEYFLRKGFTNFAFYGFKNVVWSEERCQGFRDELARHNMEHSFFEYSNDEQKDLWYYESEMLIEWLKILPKPVALMTCDDNQGHHITEICKQYNIQIPSSVSVLGVDNDEAICTLSDPPLSSIFQAVEKGGYETAALIDRMIKHPQEKPVDIVVLPTHIVTRQSTDIYATDDKCISVVLRYIHQHTNRRVSVDELVALVPLSRRLLEIRFREVTGQPIYTYILTLRINKFAQQLIDSTDSIADIAASLGFSDYKNIARQFKLIKGCSPSEYRVQHAL